MADTVALVAPAGAARTQVAKYLDDAGILVHEVDELAAPHRFAAVVVIDEPDDHAAEMRARVQGWLDVGSSRIVVMTPKPVAWTALARAHDDRLRVIATPAFGWQIVDVVRAALSAHPIGD